MKILADRNIPFAAEAFASLGDVTAIPGRAMTAADAAGCGLLLVRSVTPVGPALLDGSRVSFVATATIGTDHIDLDYLAERGIGFASAAGCNARSVSEYVAAALLHLAVRDGLSLSRLRLGVVGHGNIGSMVAAWARALGLDVRVCDPPLARAGGGEEFLPFEELLDCDALTFHVPLVRDGPDATFHHMNEAVLARLNPNAILMNTSRGAVFDNRALLAAIENGRPGPVVLDVWENEPAYDPALLDRAAIGTAHVAGYSFDGKVTGTRMIQHAAVAHFGRGQRWDPAPHLPAPAAARLEIRRKTGEAVESVLARAVRAVYDLRADDARLRESGAGDPAARGAAFDALRANYPVRREFTRTRIALAQPDPEIKAALRALGFGV